MNEQFGRGRDYNVNEYPTFTDWIFTLIQFAAVTLNRTLINMEKKKKQKTENTLCILLQIIHQAEFLSFVSAPRQ